MDRRTSGETVKRTGGKSFDSAVGRVEILDPGCGIRLGSQCKDRALDHPDAMLRIVRWAATSAPGFCNLKDMPSKSPEQAAVLAPLRKIIHVDMDAF